MTDKPKLRVIDGDMEQIARKVLNLLMSPENHKDEIDRLLEMLKPRGVLSLVKDGQSCPPVPHNTIIEK